jgi:hypothetical protein
MTSRQVCCAATATSFNLSIGMITGWRHGTPRFDEHADAAL